MAEHEDRENFIPFRKADIVEMCCQDGKIPQEQQQGFRDFCKILENYYHVEHFELTEKLKDSYYPFNPDKDTKSKREFPLEELKKLEKEFLGALTEVLEGANYEQVSQEDLKSAMDEQSLFTISLAVDFDDFEQFLVFKRGEHRKLEILKKMFGLKKKELDMVIYDRVVLFIQFKNEEYFRAKGKLKNLPFEPGTTILKLFKNIPKADIEMLFPNATPKMSTLDKVLMGVPGIGAGLVTILKVLPALGILVGIMLSALGLTKVKGENLMNFIAKPEYIQALQSEKFPPLIEEEAELFQKKFKKYNEKEDLPPGFLANFQVSKDSEYENSWIFSHKGKNFLIEKEGSELSISLNELDLASLIQVFVGLAILAGFGFKQYMGYKNKKLKFAKILSDNLYFRNLDNNGGVFYHLIDAAEEEECKEALLAYYFLLTHGRSLTEEQLDETIEQWFEKQHHVKIDFEVDDALGKLQRLEIGKVENGNWTALPLDKAKERIDYIWDNIFSYNG